MILDMKKGHLDTEVFGEMWLPKRPHATNHFPDNERLPREEALMKRNIQVNSDAAANLLTVDIDERDADLRALEYTHGLSPAWVAIGPKGHAHAAWRIKSPVSTSQASRRRPVEYARDAQEGLRRKCGGDPGYKGYMTKNPLSGAWDVIHGTREGLEGYTLKQMHSFLEDAGFWPESGWQYKEPPATTLGRNCAIFDETRKWAYRQVKKHAPDATRFGEVVENYALSANLAMYESNPLSTAEVFNIARSITRWITRQPMWTGRVEELPAWYRERKAQQGRNGAQSRWGDPAERDALFQKIMEGQDDER